MFTWICPKCQGEVPPSYSECPNCAAAQQTPAAEAQAKPPATPPPAPPVAAAPAPQPPPPPVMRHGMPGWLVAVLVAVAMVAAGAGAYYFLPSNRAARSAAEPPPSFEAPTAVAATPAAPHALAKHIEITGLRITEENKKTRVTFLVVNHSAADVADLGATVTLRPASAKPDEPPLTSFEFKLSSLGPYESKEIMTPITTQLRAYELPDWQFLKPEFRITSP